jgi:hypothetical protein
MVLGDATQEETSKEGEKRGRARGVSARVDLDWLNRHMPKFAATYRDVALLIVNTLVALVILNGMAWVALRVRDEWRPRSNPVSSRYGDQQLRQVYPDLSDREMRDLLTETWGRPLQFEPFTQFKEAEVHGRYVNVHAMGFRASGPNRTPPWPPRTGAANIFVFGGSTTFGYGVPDDQTIPAHLHTRLAAGGLEPVVYNFGRASYFSSQERVLFEQLLLAGHVPQLAIFVDGINEFTHADGAPARSARLRQALDGTPTLVQLGQLMSATPLGQVTRTLLRRASGNQIDLDEAAQSADDDLRGRVDKGVTRYFHNKRLIEAVADAYGVTPVFVWQPAPDYKYDQAYHPFKGDGSGPQAGVADGYAQMALRIDQLQRRDSFLWLADIQQERKQPLYVDQVHYTGAFAKVVAEAVGDFVLARYRPQQAPAHGGQAAPGGVAR